MNSTTDRTVHTAHLTLKDKNIIFFIVLILVPMTQSAIDLYSPSLPNVALHFQSSEKAAQQTISVYLFALGLGQFFYGFLADRFGRKKILLQGLIIFVLSSIAGIYSNDIATLTFVRLLQGLSLASTAVLTKAITVDIFTGKDLVKAYAWIGFIWGLSPIALPVVGGYLSHVGGWKLSLFSLFLYGAFSLLFVAFFLKETSRDQLSLSFKKYLLNSLFVLRNKDFICSTLIIAFTTLSIFLFNTMAPFIIQTDMGKSPVFYGNMALTVGFSYVFGAFVSKFAVRFFEDKKIVWFSVILVFLTGLAMFFLSELFPLSLWILMLPTCIVSFICAFTYPFLLTRMYGPFQTDMAGTVGANYGIISYGLSSLITYLFSQTHMTSVRELSYAFLVIGVGCIVCSFILNPIKGRRHA